ncbi:tetratricopeptide repeat protein [Aurantimonas sp. Leaf443]|uniref:tetratricopeptide repeat protein n=1 Tax=Aurantimonas sp. Leaf443 TaxID=1736378 RepID=UPI0006F839E7|nr:tetratricopeptide repeat protein [Aurantimonas sp. Leaf443]KQT85746.1 hypothetical protein ASG48_03755 [Aurantimonas sp. Leaf443]
MSMGTKPSRDGARVGCGLTGLAAAATMAIVAAGPCAAQTQVPPRAEAVGAGPEIDARRDALFRRMMADPSNLDLAFDYAALSSQAGDLEAAVATLERMLIFAPGLPRLQLELGVLYYRLGATQTARTYFEAAVSGPDVPQPVRDRVDVYLARLDDADAPSRLDGLVTLGGAYQTNANAAPSSRTIGLNGVDYILDDTFTERPDVNGFASLLLNYSHDLPGQGDRLEATFTAYGSLYAERDELNTALAELTVGPSFDLGRYGLDDTRLSVYGILGGAVLQADPYLASGGLGIQASTLIDPQLRLTGNLEARHEAFQDSTDRPTSSDRTGERYNASLAAQYALSDRTVLFSTLIGERRLADADYLSYGEVGGVLGVSHSFASPVAALEAPWTLTLAAGLSGRWFDEPDRLVGSDEEHDREFFLQATQLVPLRDEWAMQLQAGYRDVASNYDMRDYDNLRAAIAILKRF